MNPMPHQATGLGGQLRGLLVGLALVSSSLPGAPGRSGPLNTWLDLPEWLDLSIDYTSEPMTGITGGANPSAASWYQTVVLDLSMSSGFAKNRKDWNELDHWQLNLQLTNNAGDPNLNSELGAAFALQTLANPVGTWITEVSMIRNQGESWWQAELGLLSLSPVSPGEPGFLSAPAMNSYISSVLNNTFNLLIVGVPINPFVAPGVKLQASSESLGSLEYGYFYLNPQKNIASSLGVDPGIPDVEGGVQALQWKSNPLLSRTDLKEDIIIPKSKKILPDNYHSLRFKSGVICHQRVSSLITEATWEKERIEEFMDLSHGQWMLQLGLIIVSGPLARSALTLAIIPIHPLLEAAG